MNFFVWMFVWAGSCIWFYISTMFSMCTDNICWIPDSPEWTAISKNFNIFILKNKIFCIPKNKEGLDYCWNHRILEVLKHPRDVIPAIITSFINGTVLALILGAIL